MFHRKKKQKPDYQVKSADAYSALLRAMNKFVARSEPSCLDDFSLVLDAYHEIPAKYWTPEDKVRIAGTFLYIMQLFDHLGNRVMREDNQEARDLIMRRFDKFIRLLNADTENQKFTAFVLIACAHASYANAMITDNSTAEEEQKIFDKYCQPAYDLLGCEQEKLLMLQDDAVITYVFDAQGDLANRYYCAGLNDVAIKLYFLALETAAEIQNIGNDYGMFGNLFQYLGCDLFQTPVVSYGKVTPMVFLENVYKGSARFYDFTCAASVMERQQPIDLLQLKFFVKGLRLVDQHFGSDDLPDSDFLQHMQEEYFQNVFYGFYDRLRARLASVDGLSQQYGGLEMAMLDEVSALRSRIESMDNLLQEQGVFARPAKKVKTVEEQDRQHHYNLRSFGKR